MFEGGWHGKRGLGVAALLLTMTTVAAACGGSSGGGAAAGGSSGSGSSGDASSAGGGSSKAGSVSGEGTTKTFKLALVAPITGGSALIGTQFKDSAALALTSVGSRIGPYKIVPVWVDEHGGDPAKATQDYQSAVSGGNIGAGCLNWHGSVGIALMDVVARYKIPQLFSLAAPGTINDKFNKDREKYGYWATKGWPSPAKLIPGYVEALTAAEKDGSFKPANHDIAISGEDTDYGRYVAKAVDASFKKAGWQVKATDFFPADTNDHHAMLNKYKSLGVSVVFTTASSPNTISALIKQRKEVGLKGLLIGDGLGYVSDFYKLTGPASDGVLDQQPVFSTPKQLAFAATFKKKYGIDPSPAAAGLSYDYTNFCLKVLQRTYDRFKTLDSKSVYQEAKDELWSGKLTYTNGIVMHSYRYSPQTIPDPVVGTDAFFFPVTQYFGGKPKVIYPADAANAKLQTVP